LPGRGKIVAPIDFLVAMELLTATRVEGGSRAGPGLAQDPSDEVGMKWV